MKRQIIQTLIVVLALSAFAAAAQTARPFTVNDLLKVRRVGDPQVSPDGKWIAYSISDVDRDANKSKTQIYLVAVAGGEPKQLTNGDKSASSPRWSPDGKRIAYVTSGQIWTMNADGSDAKKVTSISTGAGDPIWSPDDKWLAFASDVYPECTNDACNKQRAETAENSKVKAKIADRLLYRHWVEWKEGKRTHIFVVSADGGDARDLTPGDYDAPPFEQSYNYAFSPDSTELAFSRNTDKVEATSTNADISIVPVAEIGRAHV